MSWTRTRQRRGLWVGLLVVALLPDDGVRPDGDGDTSRDGRQTRAAARYPA